MKYLSGFLLLLVTAMTVSAADSSTETNPSGAAVWVAVETPLTEAVRQFNEFAARQPMGVNEPPLTAEEVIAAIRGWVPQEHPVKPEILKIYQKIANTGMLPPGASLSAITRWIGYNGYLFDVWWVDLGIAPLARARPDPVIGYGYNFRIRDRKIRSRPMTKEDEMLILPFKDQ